MFTIVTFSTFGWDHVTQGLVQFGFTLMDSYGPKGVFGRLPEGISDAAEDAHSECLRSWIEDSLTDLQGDELIAKTDHSF